MIGQYGLTLPELYVENVSLPPAVEAALDKRTSLGIVGDLGRYAPFSAAEAMTSAAGDPAGGGMAAGLGAGIGLAMAQLGPWGAMTAAPPPPPVEHVWHLVENGEAKGLYSRATLGRMAADGAVTR